MLLLSITLAVSRSNCNLRVAWGMLDKMLLWSSHRTAIPPLMLLLSSIQIPKTDFAVRAIHCAARPATFGYRARYLPHMNDITPEIARMRARLLELPLSKPSLSGDWRN